MRAAIYCRVSTDMQAEDEIPIIGQINECQKYAELKGWQVVEVYKDEGFTSRNTNRPGFQRLLAEANNKPIPFEKLIVWKGRLASAMPRWRQRFPASVRTTAKNRPLSESADRERFFSATVI